MTGAGLTSVMSCAAAAVMSNPADCMAGCMRGASDSRLNGESGEGKAKELAAVTASICSTEDCIMLARVFNSAKASCDTLRQRRQQHFIINGIYGKNLVVEGCTVDTANCADKGIGFETE
jgi:hypothetical protein